MVTVRLIIATIACFWSVGNRLVLLLIAAIRTSTMSETTNPSSQNSLLAVRETH